MWLLLSHAVSSAISNLRRSTNKGCRSGDVACYSLREREHGRQETYILPEELSGPCQKLGHRIGEGHDSALLPHGVTDQANDLLRPAQDEANC